MANKYWVGATGLWSSTTNWKTASGGSTNSGIPTSSDVAIIDGNSGSPTITISAAASCGSLLVQPGANLTTAGTGALTVSGTNGSVTFNEYVNWGNTGIMTISSTTAGTFRCSGSTLRCPIYFSGTGGITLQDTFTMGPATGATAGPLFAHSAGTLNLNDQAMNIYGTMSISSATTRSIRFGSAGAYIYIAPGAAATAFQASTLTGFTYTGTSRIIVGNNSSAGLMQVSPGVPTAAQSMNFEFSAGTSIGLNGSVLNLDCQTSSFYGNLNINGAFSVYGNLYLSSSMTQTSVANIVTMAATSGTKTIDTQGIAIIFYLTISGVGGTFQLVNNLTMGTGVLTKVFTVSYGTFDVNGYQLSVASSNATLIGTTGNYTIKNVNSSTTALFNIVSGSCTFGTSVYFGGPVTLTAGTMILAVNTVIAGVFTHTGGTINLSTYSLSLLTSYSGGASAKTFTFGTGSYITVGDPNYSSAPAGTAWVSGGATINGTSDVRLYATGGTITVSSSGSETTALNWTFSGGSYQLNISTNTVFKNFTITNTSGGGQQPNVYFLTCFIYGNYYNGGNYGPATFSSSSSVLTFGGTLAITRTIYSDNSPETWSQPIVFSTTGGTTSLSTNLATSSSMNFASGTLNLNNYNLTCGSFVNNNGAARVLNFGTAAAGWDPSTVNAITVTGNGTVYNGNTPTGYSHTGSYPLIRVIPAAPSGTIQVTPGAATEAQALNFQFYNGSNGSSWTLGFLNLANNYVVKDVDFGYYGNFTGTWSAVTACFIDGSLALNSSMTIQSSTNIMSFSGSSASNINHWDGGAYRLIYNNGQSIPFPIAFNGTSSIWYLGDAMNLTSATTPQLYLVTGTLHLNGLTLTTPAVQTSVGTKNLTFDGGTLYVTNATTTAFNNLNPTGFTTSVGTATGYIILTAATAKTFVGGGSTYNCIVQTTGAGAMTVSGNSTFTALYYGASSNLIITGNNTIADLECDSTQNSSLTLTAGTTQTLTGTINVQGSYFYGTYATVSSGTANSQATLTRSGAWTSSQVLDYCIFKDLNFTPNSNTGATPIVWFGGNDSINNGNITGIVLISDYTYKVYFISSTSTTSWTTPTDWNPFNNVVVLIGGGGAGGPSVASGTLYRAAGGGGGGAGGTVINAYPDFYSTTVPITIGTGGSAGTGTSISSGNITGTGGSGQTTKFGNLTTSMYYGTFNGTSQYLQMDASPTFPRISTEDFSMEAWIYPTLISNVPIIFEDAYQTSTTAGGWYLYITPSGQMAFTVYTGVGTNISQISLSLASMGAVQLNQWSHVGVARYGGVVSVFLNGTSTAGYLYTTAINLNSGSSANWNTRIGARVVSGAGQQYFTGRISNARIIIGSSAYNGNYYPPQATLSGGTLCTLNSATVVDNSGNAYNITNVGSVSMTSGITLPYAFAGGGQGGTAMYNTVSGSYSLGGYGGAGTTSIGGSGGQGGYTSTSQGVGGGGGGGAGGPDGGWFGPGSGGAGTTSSTATQVSGGGGGGGGAWYGSGGAGTTTVGGAGGGNYFDGSGGGAGTTGAGGNGGSGGGGAGGQNTGAGGNPGVASQTIVRTWGPSGGSGGSANANSSTEYVGYTGGTAYTNNFGGGSGGAGQGPTAVSLGSVKNSAQGGSGAIIIGYSSFTWTTGTPGSNFFDFL